jgi:hypothetical protein
VQSTDSKVYHALQESETLPVTRLDEDVREKRVVQTVELATEKSVFSNQI